jgi:Fic family protein
LLGYRHIPPAHPKLRDLLIGLERFAESPVAPLTRAAVVHMEFVTIHPFFDGNGRLGRLLLNLELLRAGFPWVTVRADERRAFFAAIERAQVDGDTRDYAACIEQLVRAAAKDLTARLRDRAKR